MRGRGAAAHETIETVSGCRDNALGIYISIPFCRSKCTYCNFASGVFPAARHEQYIDRLLEDLHGASSWAVDAGLELPRRVDTVYLGCWRREVFAKSGLFDPELVRNQDDELNFRLRRMGGRIWQSPRIRSVYCPRDSIRVLFRQYMQYGFWKVAVIRKHRALAAWRHLAPALFVCSIAAGVILAMGSMVAGMPHTAFWIAAGVGAELALYLLVCVAAALPSKSLGFPTLLLVPAAMTVYHVSYGLGFVLGILRSGKRSEPLFTALTRR